MTTEAAPHRFQPDESSARIAGFAILGTLSLIALGVAVVALMYGLFDQVRPRHSPPPQPVYARTAGPRLEARPVLDRLAVERRARARLEGYGWVDRKAGVAHIPIERAMAIQAARGWPDAEPSP